MTPILKKLGVVGALALGLGTMAQAQVANQSDIIISIISTTPAGGAYTPGGGGRGGGGGGRGGSIPPGVVGGVMGNLNGGSINSPITGGAITGAPATNLGALFGGSPVGLTNVTNALTGAGAPAGLVAALVQALSGLGNSPTAGQVIAAAEAFNALVANAGTPNAALNNPQTLAIHAALTALLGGIV